MEVRDINMLFANTIVQVGKEKLWYYVNGVSDDRTALCLDMETQKIKRIPFEEDKWRAPTSRLGYLNIGDVCIYVSRHAVRKYKQGISRDCVEFSIGDMRLAPGDEDAVGAVVKTLGSEPFMSCLKGEYPSFTEAVQRVQAGARCLAFDRQFAVDASLKVYYKGKWVGKVNADQTGIAFKDKFKYLQRVVVCQ